MNRSVLVVDDHPLVRDMVRTMLEARGINVALAKNGTEAIERFASQCIPAVVMDVDMPGPNGVEICRTLRDFAVQHQRSVSIWLMTGVDRPGLAAQAEAAGALGVIAKPFTTAQLLSRVEDMLAGASAAA